MKIIHFPTQFIEPANFTIRRIPKLLLVSLHLHASTML